MFLCSENYHSLEANEAYLSVSQYKSFAGTLGRPACESMALARLHGEWDQEMTPALLVGSYVDAHFEGTLDIFKAQNRKLFKRNGELLVAYVRANEIIQRIERDPYLMECLSGKTQVIFTADLYGAKWKVKLDSYHEAKAIVDLKLMKSIDESFWVKDVKQRMSFVPYWGYDLQGAIYQEVVRLNTGHRLPFLLAVASKEKETNIEVVGFNTEDLTDLLPAVKNYIPRILQLKEGTVEPDRCGVCDYCRRTKVLTGPKHFRDLLEKV